MNLDGSEKTNISNSKSIDWVYYAYKDKIYFVSDRDTTARKFLLYQMNIDGMNVKRISQFLLDDSWITSRKNASEFIIASSKDSSLHELYLIDSTGNEIERLTDNDYYDTDACFSPDGQQIVFRSRRPKIDELWIMDLDGKNLRQLTYYPESDLSAGEFDYHAGPPYWESHSNLISFTSKQNNNYSIFTIKPDGSGLKQLTFGIYDEMWHSWSPDGLRIVFDGTDEDKNYDIYLMNSDGTNIERLTNDDQFEQAPVFVSVPGPVKKG
jgi:TolB protein